MFGLSSSSSLSKGAVHPKIIINSQNNIRINLSLRIKTRKYLHIKQLICLLVIAIALFDDLLQHIALIVWKPILEFHQGPHMATIYKGKKQTNKLLLYSSLTNISIAESSTLAFPCTKFERKAAKKFNHGHLFLDFRS